MDLIKLLEIYCTQTLPYFWSWWNLDTMILLINDELIKLLDYYVVEIMCFMQNGKHYPSLVMIPT